MKKAIIYSAVLCGVSWIAALVFHLATGYTGPESGVDSVLKFRTFAMVYMFLPAIVALVLQAVGGELSIVRRHATRIQVVPADNSLLKFRPRWSWLVAILTTVAMVALSLLFSALFADFSTMKQTTLDLIIAQGIDNVPAEQIAQVEALPEWVMVLSTVLSGIFAGVTINALFAFGEEYGWRCYMVKALGGRKFLSAALLIGFVWGIWHSPLILMGHNYPDARVVGVAMMVLFCILGGIIELYFVLKSGSMWAAVFIHGTINALAGMMAMVVVIALLYLYDRSHDRIFHSTL